MHKTTAATAPGAQHAQDSHVQHESDEPGRDELDQIAVRNLVPEDLEAVILLDARNVGRRRDEYFKLKLAQNLHESGIRVSLAAEVDGRFAGFLLARVYYGEFGMMEPAAVLDTIGVHPDFRGQGVGRALMRQLKLNLRGLNVGRLQSDVSWEDQAILAFFHHEGFRPAPRFCLDLDLTRRT